jgi:hypothetical protein
MASLADGISTLQQWKDFNPNLFEMTLFGKDDKDEIEHVKFFCKGFKINGMGFVLERNYANKEFFINNYKLADTLTIEWRENQDLYIYKYHQKWLDSYYNRVKDHFIVGANPKKNATIVFQKIEKTADKFTATDDFTTTFTFHFVGLIPENVPDLEGGWDRSGEVIRSISYKFDSWSYK